MNRFVWERKYNEELHDAFLESSELEFDTESDFRDEMYSRFVDDDTDSKILDIEIRD